MKKSLDLIWKIRLKLRAEANKLEAEANKLWAEGILGFCGNIKIEWKNYDTIKNDYECHLENGEIFQP